MINIRLSGWLPKFSSLSVLIPPCESRNLDAERCKMTDLRCIMILLARTLVSHKVLCLGKWEFEEKGQRNFHAVTWQSISRDAGQATAQSNHQCRWEDWFHAEEHEKKGRYIVRKPESILESAAWTYISCNWRSTNFVFRRIMYRRERRADTWHCDKVKASYIFYSIFSAAVTKPDGWTTSLPMPWNRRQLQVQNIRLKKYCIWICTITAAEYHSSSCFCRSAEFDVGHATECLEYSLIPLRSFGIKDCLCSNF